MSQFDPICEERIINLLSDISTFYKRHGSITISPWLKECLEAFKASSNKKISFTASNCIRQLDVLHVMVSKGDTKVSAPPSNKTQTAAAETNIKSKPLTKEQERLDVLIKSLLSSLKDNNKNHIDMSISLLKKADISYSILKEARAVEQVKSAKKMTTDFALQQQIQSVLTIWKERCLQQEIKKKEELQKNLSKYSTPTTQHTIIRDRIPSKSTSQAKRPASSVPAKGSSSRQPVKTSVQPKKGQGKVLIVPQKRSEIENCRQYLEDDYEDDGFVVPDDGDDIFGEDYREALRGLNRHYGDKKYYNDDDDDDRNMVSTIDQIENEDRVSRKIGKKVDQEEWIKIQEEERREAMRRKK